MRKQTIDESIGVQTNWFKDNIKSPQHIEELKGKTMTIKYTRYEREIINTFTFKDNSITVKLIIPDREDHAIHSINDIEIVFERCNYNNYRFYFKCPDCNANYTKLYFRGNKLGCRKCMNLSYNSSRRSGNKLEEIRYKMIKIHRTLKTEHSMSNLHPDRPKNMRFKTYCKLIAELQHLERCFNHLMGDMYFRRGTYKDITTNEFIDLMRT